MADNQASGAERKRDNRFLAIVILGIALIAALLGVIALLLLKRESPPVRTEVIVQDSADEQARRAVVINEENAEEAVEELINQPATPMGYYEVSMNFSWIFPDGASASENAFAENPLSNTSDVYFDVVLEEDESVTLYASPLLPPGTHINEAKLTRDLDAGTYPCVVIYHLVDDQQRTTSTLRMNMEIVVNN